LWIAFCLNRLLFSPYPFFVIPLLIAHYPNVQNTAFECGLLQSQSIIGICIISFYPLISPFNPLKTKIFDDFLQGIL